MNLNLFLFQCLIKSVLGVGVGYGEGEKRGLCCEKLEMSLKGFPFDSAGEESACNVGNLGSIPRLGRSLEKGKATYSSILAWRIPWTV